MCHCLTTCSIKKRCRKHHAHCNNVFSKHNPGSRHGVSTTLMLCIMLLPGFLRPVCGNKLTFAPMRSRPFESTGLPLATMPRVQSGNRGKPVCCWWCLKAAPCTHRACYDDIVLAGADGCRALFTSSVTVTSLSHLPHWVRLTSLGVA